MDMERTVHSEMLRSNNQLPKRSYSDTAGANACLLLRSCNYSTFVILPSLLVQKLDLRTSETPNRLEYEGPSWLRLQAI